MTIKAVLFDMDGVLIDAREWHYEALNEALEPFGYHINQYDHDSRFNGLTTKKKLEILNTEKGFPVSLNSVVNSVKQDLTLRIAALRCYPIVPILILFNRLKQSGIKIAVVTNSIKNSSEVMLKYAGVLEFVDVLISNEDVKHNKPNPECYLLALSRLSLAPEEVIVVEDGEYGIAAARAAACLVIPVSSPFDVNIGLVSSLIPKLLETK